MVATGLLATGCNSADKWTDLEWSRVHSLSPLLDPLAVNRPFADSSNCYYDKPEAAALGRSFYFDTGFSGNSTLQDSIGRTVASARTPKDCPVNVSCASCHDPSWAGTDDTSVPNTVSIGAGIYDVNAQQTLVAAFFPLLYWNGRSDSLWSQALAVNMSKFSMNGTSQDTFNRIVSNYVDRYTAVFNPASDASDTAVCGRFPLPSGATPTPDEVTRVFVNFGKAIAAYEYTLASQYSLASHDAPFDRFVHDGPDSPWISPQAKNGARLFVGKASCFDCHNTPLFSDGRFHNIGVPQAGDHVPTVEDCALNPAKCDCTPLHEKSSCLPSGAWAGTRKLAESSFRRNSQWSDDVPNGGWPDGGWPDGSPPEPDGGARCATTEIDTAPKCSAEPEITLKGAWRTPSLRDVAITAPYMHDGYYQTLTQVVQHYNMGGVAGAANAFQLPICGHGDAGPSPCMDAGAPAPHVAAQIKPLGLTDEEVADLVAFLETLTSPPLPAGVAQPPDGGVPPALGCPDASPSQ